jgi:deoxycytidine triphosphate deaminase
MAERASSESPRSQGACLLRKYRVTVSRPLHPEAQPNTRMYQCEGSMAKRSRREASSAVKLSWLLHALNGPKYKRIRLKFPSTALPWRDSTIESIEEQRYHWELGKDYLALGGAVRLCRSDKIDFPEWLQEGIGNAVDQTFELVTDPSKRNTAVKISKALGFGYGRLFSHWRDLNLNYYLFIRYKTLRGEGMGVEAAIEQIADEIRFSARTVRRRLGDFADCFATENITFDELVAIQQEFDLNLEPHSRIAERRYLEAPHRTSERHQNGDRSPPGRRLLTSDEIEKALDCEHLIISPRPKPEYLGYSRIALTLNSTGFIGNSFNQTDKIVSMNPYRITCGSYVIGSTRENIDLPINSPLKVRVAPLVGLEMVGIKLGVSGEIYRGFTGSLLLPIFNMSDIPVDLVAESRIGELMVEHR